MFSRRNDLPESRDSTNDSQPTNCFPHSTMRPLPPPPLHCFLQASIGKLFAVLQFDRDSRYPPSPPPLFYFPPSTINHRLLFSFHPPLVIVLSFESSVCRVSLAAFRMDRDRYSIERLLFVSFRKRKRTEWVEGGGKEGRKKKKKGQGSSKRCFEIEQRNLPRGSSGCIGRWKSGCFNGTQRNTRSRGAAYNVATTDITDCEQETGRRTRCGELFGRVTFRKNSFVGIKRIPPSFPPIPPR